MGNCSSIFYWFPVRVGKLLQNLFISLALDITEGEEGQAEHPNNEGFPVMESASSVRPFNLEQTGLYQWNPNSKRWRDKFMKLLSADESEVTRIGDMFFIKTEEFRIAMGSNGTEVYLGLRDDRTELAIKIVLKSNYQVNEQRILRLPGLYDARIVRYINYKEDEQFSYLALQLCEYTLGEYIKIKPGDVKKLVRQILKVLKALHCQNPPILHTRLNPRNILIDVNGNARLAGFGRSRRLTAGETECLMKKTDIEMAGKLIYYIYSEGRHPFGEIPTHKGTYNLDDVKDVLAKEFIKMMVAEPQKRPNVEECLNHPFFWSTERRVDYLQEFGNRMEAVRCRKASPQLISSLNESIGDGSFTEWKKKFPSELVKKLEERKEGPYPEHMLGLLRFIRNVYQHHSSDAADMDLESMFPRLFECAYIFAESQGWNSEPLLKQVLEKKR